MPGRSFTSSSYRYGFNGKENDPESIGTGSGTQDYGMRIYNPALGRFLSTDPLFKSFAYKTPYDFAENSPIMGIDLDGGELEFFMLAKVGVFGKASQQIARDIDKGALKSVNKFGMGIMQMGKLTGGQATGFDYVNTVVGITSQALYVNTPGANKVIANNLSKSKNGALNAVGNGMKALAKEEADVNKAFKEGNTEKIAEVVTDVGILAATMVITEGITAYCTPAEAVIVADEMIAGNSVGAARSGFSSILKQIDKISKRVSAKYGVFDCVPWADDFAKGLEKAGIPYDFVEIQSSGGGALWSETEGGVISTNGYHKAVSVEGNIYDNIHTEGINPHSWKKDISTTYGQEVNELK